MLKAPKVLLYHKPALALLSGLTRAELYGCSIPRPISWYWLRICRGNHLCARDLHEDNMLELFARLVHACIDVTPA